MSVVITSSVGRGGVNRAEDVRTVQALLNRHIQPPRQPLEVDGSAGSNTIAAIEAFQQQRLSALHISGPDGRVDPGGRTLAALAGDPIASPATPPAPAPGLPPVGDATALTEADFQRAAAALNCEVACIKAVSEVESAGGGFYRPSKRPKILFEAHWFSKFTNHQYDGSNPDISSLKWNRSLYKGGEKEYDRLQKAMQLNREAALKSASWGRFQIMGFNHPLCGFDAVDNFVTAMYESEGRQLDAFINFLKSRQLDKALRAKRWADFARGYNGEAYAQNRYDSKLRTAYEKYSKQA